MRLARISLFVLVGGGLGGAATPVDSLEESSRLLVMLTPPADISRAPGQEIGPVGP